MIIIIGGSNQGKKEFVKFNYQLSEDDILDVTNNYNIDNYRVLYHFERVVLYKKDLDMDKLKNKIIIFEDVFSSVVPVDSNLRKYREEAGHLLQILVAHADHVIRITAGIKETLK